MKIGNHQTIFINQILAKLHDVSDTTPDVTKVVSEGYEGKANLE